MYYEGIKKRARTSTHGKNAYSIPLAHVPIECFSVIKCIHKRFDLRGVPLGQISVECFSVLKCRHKRFDLRGVPLAHITIKIFLVTKQIIKICRSRHIPLAHCSVRMTSGGVITCCKYWTSSVAIIFLQTAINSVLEMTGNSILVWTLRAQCTCSDSTKKKTQQRNTTYQSKGTSCDRLRLKEAS